MSRKYFGTDGIRGRVGRAPMSPDFVLKLGYAVGKLIAADNLDGRGKVIIGKDTRISGYMFESALEAGLSAAGVDSCFLGPIPTPAVAYLTRTLRADAGVVISASHNPYYDNGIKFFGANGVKFSDELELAIESALEDDLVSVDSHKLGKAYRVSDAHGRYIEFCKSTLSNTMNFKNLKIALDCAHGATYHIAPKVFEELGAEVLALGVSPDGVNINQEVGATDTRALEALVVENQCDLGIAFDGDGDRLMMVTSAGKTVDGDEILAILAKHYQETQGYTKGIVGTVMTNLGVENYIKSLGLSFGRAKVGDRFVKELMQKNGSLLGGESSGHIICGDKNMTGDGIVSALAVIEAMMAKQSSLEKLIDGIDKYPQTLINVSMTHRTDVTQAPEIQALVAEAENNLGDKGRVLLRLSGTEPLVRVMVEGEEAEQVEKSARLIADGVKRLVNKAG